MDRNDLLFWTDILADHAEFQTNAFSSREEPYIREAQMFHSVFQQYNMELQSKNYTNSLEHLKNEVIKFISFKKKIITELLRCNILINFPPSFINHMVNEASEFLSLFNSDICPEKTKTPATYIKLWIADASGHTSSIISSLDAAETILLKDTQCFKSKFDDLYKKCSELEMIQNNLNDFMFVDLLKSEAISALRQFIEFCKGLLSLLSSCNVMSNGTFCPAIVNHFIKEHEYVIRKITACI